MHLIVINFQKTRTYSADVFKKVKAQCMIRNPRNGSLNEQLT